MAIQLTTLKAIKTNKRLTLTRYGMIKEGQNKQNSVMKIDASRKAPADAKIPRLGLRRVMCSLFLVGAAVAIGSPRANPESMRLNNTLPGNIIVVTNTNDSGPGSLRDALAVAKDGDTIDFDSSLKGQTITLTSGQMIVDKDVTISGPGANNLVVDGHKQSRVFYINLGKTVTIAGLTLKNSSYRLRRRHL